MLYNPVNPVIFHIYISTSSTLPLPGTPQIPFYSLLQNLPALQQRPVTSSLHSHHHQQPLTQQSQAYSPIFPYTSRPSPYPTLRKRTPHTTMYEDYEVDCFELGCLQCDRPTTTGQSYCSQSCRLAQVDSSSTFLTATSTNTNTNTNTNPSTTSNTATNYYPEPPSSRSITGFFLLPAINFQSYRSSASSSATSSPSSSSPPSPKLSPSTSRSCLKNELSLETQCELLDYTNAFDRSREWKRRMTY